MKSFFQSRYCQHAFTLIEIIVSISILALILIFAAGILPSSYLTMRRAAQYQFASNQALLLLEKGVSSIDFHGCSQYPEYLHPSEVFLKNNPPSMDLKSLHSLPFSNYGKFSTKIEDTEISFYYLLTFYDLTSTPEIRREVELLYNPDGEMEREPFFILADVTVDIWWEPTGRELDFSRVSAGSNGGVKNSSSFSHIRYIQRVYNRRYK